MYTTVVVIAIAVIVIQYQLSSLNTKLAELKTENELLKASIKDDGGKLAISISGLENSIDALEKRADRIENDDIHGFADDISFLKKWVKNVGQIATSTRDKINPSVDN